VRGTDFVMSVDETGKSMIMLMPTCETEQSVNLKGLACGSGKIDVDSGSIIIRLDKPYQATIVETASTPPSPPVIVNLSNTPIGNNLIVRPPLTMSGTSIQQAARAAAAKTGDAKRDDEKTDSKDNSPDTAESKTTDDHRKDQQEKAATSQAAEDRVLAILIELKDKGVVVNDKAFENEHVVRYYKNDNPNLNQLGIGYMSLSPTGNNFTAISLNNDNKLLVVVTQDRQTDAFNFAGGYNRPQGSIVINQSYK
jgi:hypothetical protein